MKSKKFLILFTPILLVWVLDQLTKHWVRYSLELHRHEVIDGWLAFNYTQNPGMALGMNWISTPVISVIAILATFAIFIYILKTLPRANFAYLFSMGLILGGAIGNITDRLVMGIIEGYGGMLDGHVIDFIHFTLRINDTPVFPYIFNVADMAISTSIIAMIIFHKKILPIEEGIEDVNEATDSIVEMNGGEVQKGSNLTANEPNEGNAGNTDIDNEELRL
ncbi:MAG: signal peptidase II [Balneolaceae bacterium]